MKTAHRGFISTCFDRRVETELDPGPEANARLTALTAVVLTVLLAAEGATLLSLRSFISWHILLGVALVPVVALKLGSTVYRFARYYTGRAEYVRAGPPPLPMRLLGPVVVLSTVALLGSGLLLIAVGPGRGLPLLLHKASFVVWFGAMALHVLGHALRVPRVLAGELHPDRGVGESRARLLLVAASVVAGATIAVALAPTTTSWVHWVRSADGAVSATATR
jgi:hypothetical protein